MLTTTQYECAECDAIGLAVKCDEHGEPVAEDADHHHLRCNCCDARIVYLNPDLDDEFGFDDDAGEED